MCEFFLVRHGMADYSYGQKNNFKGHGNDLAPLDNSAIAGISKLAQNEELRHAKVIVSSPYTRAMQTAAILAKVLALDVLVDPDLREWEPDLTYQYSSFEDVEISYREFVANRGEWAGGASHRWEELHTLKNRLKSAFSRYLQYESVIIVTHKMAIKAVTEIEANCGEYVLFNDEEL